MTDRNAAVLEGEYTGFYRPPYGGAVTYTIEHPGPKPYTKTVESAGTFVCRALDEFPLGTRVRITVEVVE